MILPRRNLKQLPQQKVAHMERNVHWKKLPSQRKKCEPFYTEKLYTVPIIEKWLVKNKQTTPPPQTHTFSLQSEHDSTHILLYFEWAHFK